MGKTPQTSEMLMVQAALPKLGGDELRRIHDLISHLLGTTTDPQAGEWVYGILQEALRRLGVPCSLPYAVFVRTVGMSQHLEQVRAFVTYLEQVLKPRSKTEKYAAALFLLTRIVREVQEFDGMPVTPKTIMSHLGSVGAVIDRAFPGYAASGFLRSVVFDDSMTG